MRPTMLRYTLCFIRDSARGRVLMLFRNNPPNQYLFNGVGGKIELGESPYQANIREVFEETGIKLQEARFGGIVTWDGAPDIGRDGMYVYVAELPDGVQVWEDGKETAEGSLFWLREQTAHNDSLMLVDNIGCFLPDMLAGEEPREYHCVYDMEGRLSHVETLPLQLNGENVTHA